LGTSKDDCPTDGIRGLKRKVRFTICADHKVIKEDTTHIDLRGSEGRSMHLYQVGEDEQKRGFPWRVGSGERIDHDETKKSRKGEWANRWRCAKEKREKRRGVHQKSLQTVSTKNGKTTKKHRKKLESIE